MEPQTAPSQPAPAEGLAHAASPRADPFPPSRDAGAPATPRPALRASRPRLPTPGRRRGARSPQASSGFDLPVKIFALFGDRSLRLAFGVGRARLAPSVRVRPRQYERRPTPSRLAPPGCTSPDVIRERGRHRPGKRSSSSTRDAHLLEPKELRFLGPQLERPVRHGLCKTMVGSSCGSRPPRWRCRGDRRSSPDLAPGGTAERLSPDRAGLWPCRTSTWRCASR
jgi:hypothetical protein